MQKEIIRSFKNSFPALIHDVDLKFKPHITIAYRDLGPEKFKEAWKEYQIKIFNAVFEVTDIHLLQHNTKQWNIISTYALQNGLAKQTECN